MTYGAETCAVKKAQEKKLDVAEMRMLRWKRGVNKLDRIRNERIRLTRRVGEIAKEVQESRLKWYRHKKRRRIRSGCGWITSRSAWPSSMEASHKNHRSQIQVGKVAEEEESYDRVKTVLCVKMAQYSKPKLRRLYTFRTKTGVIHIKALICILMYTLEYDISEKLKKIKLVNQLSWKWTPSWIVCPSRGHLYLKNYST